MSSLYVTGLGLTEPVGPLQPCLGSQSCVDSQGKARDQNGLEVGLFLRLLATASPSIRSSIPAFFCSAVAVSHFLFSSRLWRHRGLPGVGEVLRPPGRQMYFSSNPPPQSDPYIPIKSLGSHVKLGIVSQNLCPDPGLHSLGYPGVPSGTQPSCPSCLQLPLHPVCVSGALLSVQLLS